MQPFKQLFRFSFTPFIVFLLGFLITSFFALRSSRVIALNEELRFNSASDQIIFLLTKKLDANVQLLQSAVSFMSASTFVSREDWKYFIDLHELETFFSGIQAVGYAAKVEASHRLIFENMIAHEPFPNFRIYPQSALKKSFPIVYLEPLSGRNQKAIGYDMFSELVRRDAINHSIKRGKATISGKIELIQEKEESEKAGFVIYAPLFLKADLSKGISTEESVKGVVFVAIKAKKLFEDLLGAGYITIDFEIHDGTTGQEDSLMYDSNPILKTARLQRKVPLELYGRSWTIHFKANEILDMKEWNKNIPVSILISGFLLSLLLSVWIYMLQNTRRRAYEIAEEKSIQLIRSEARIRTIFQAMREGVLVQDANGVIIECNLAMQEMFGVSADNLIGTTSNNPKWSAIYEDGTPMPFEERPAPKTFRTKSEQSDMMMGICRQDGSRIWVLANAQPIFSDDFEEVISVVVTFNDVTEYRQSKAKLQSYVQIVDAHVIISSTDLKGIITEVSEAFCRTSGYSKEELIGKNHNIVRHPDVPDSLYKAMWESIVQGEVWQGEIKNKHKDGSSYWVHATISPRYNDAREMIGFMAIRQDITDKKRIEELSITDRLTGLFNRLKLDEVFAKEIQRSTRYHTPFSVVLLDIDRFKNVNDTYGHQVGDMVLQELALILKTNVRSEDLVGRWGGEEFLLLLPNTTLDSAMILAEKLRRSTEAHAFSEVGKCTASFGVASFVTGDSEKNLMARADDALYRAKAQGRNRVIEQIV